MLLTSLHKLSTNHCNGIWRTTRHNRLLPAKTCYGLARGKLQGNWCNGFLGKVANLLWTCYGEVVHLLQTCYGLVIYVAHLFVTQRGSRQLVMDLLRGNWCDGFWLYHNTVLKAMYNSHRQHAARLFQTTPYDRNAIR